ncbi:HAD-IC family P-type ATPase [Nitratireductor mangrovi]|uniref:HAD-IC family P-type ATPase n=1 Tax=Nitratireductor mangrovi TaxID=2599600 RepID=A0A5B8L0I6_9HYPH|nr:HAD-IC family P-type ATPase [Nitratireductor mangrovi]QDZ01359.1 HAD-IC family P-type ATPase [Nitratireductor mangrovi]
MNTTFEPPSGLCGLSEAEARERLDRYGQNALPEPRPPSILRVFLRQFLSPLIYILIAAALVSIALSDVKDAFFIGIVLLLNGIIGATQEFSAGRAAAALRGLEVPQATVIRDGVPRVIDARVLVPGDLVLLEAGSRVPADMRLGSVEDLQCDEALLTGESLPVRKDAGADGSEGRATAFAGTMVTRGRGIGEVVATGPATKVGGIAALVAARDLSRPPLLIRMERFARTIALSVGLAMVALVLIGLLRDLGLHQLFLLAVGLAVSAIPEGLPVAISVTLAIGMRRMAGVNVIVRNMPAIEALGSCTMIATDKTGTLTLNELTVTEVRLPDGTIVLFEAGRDLDACAVHSPTVATQAVRERIADLLRAAALPNEGRLVLDGDGWRGVGDTVDIALLSAARKAGLAQEAIARDHPLIARIPYEPDLKYAASFHHGGDRVRTFVKGAPETLIAMADRMATATGAIAIDRAVLMAQQADLAGRGLRVLAFAEGEIEPASQEELGHRHLVDLVFLGLAGMHDPLRAEVPGAVQACRRAGIEVAVVTGDDPRTAAAIAREAGLTFDDSQVVTGDSLRQAEAEGDDALDALTRLASIFARVEPAQKLSIVLSMARNGHFVAVTGDGANDAPALKHAHVGVAMGKRGTDIARESADIILTDDNFASIVAGIREGRVSYANIRKVVFMTVSTGAAEVLLFLLALPFGLPMPLMPLQLLWLNLVTNGIQDVALAAEGAEGDELDRPPRAPKEPIFNGVMMRRLAISTLVMGGGGFVAFWWLLNLGRSEFEARNIVLLLIVLFENFQTLNARSENHSVFRLDLAANPLLVSGIVAAQALHVAAMHVPVMAETLDLAPVALADWLVLLSLAASIFLAVEFDKWLSRRAAIAGDSDEVAGNTS